MISLFILVQRFLQFQLLSLPFSSIYCCSFFQELFWISFQWTISYFKGHNKCSWHFYVFKLLLVLCVCSVDLFALHVCDSPCTLFLFSLLFTVGKKVARSAFHNGQWKGHFRRSSSFKVTTTIPLCFIFDPTCTASQCVCLYMFVCVRVGRMARAKLGAKFWRVGDCNLMPLQASALLVPEVLL